MLTLTAPPPDAIRTLADAMVRLTRTDVFFSTLAFALNPQFTDDPTMTTACTDGVRVLLNPQFFTRLSVSEQVALLKHEVMHVAFEHVFRRGDRHPKRWNIACDYVINLIIKQEGGALPGGGLCDEQYEGLIEEEVYERLPEGIEDRFDLGDLRESEDGLSPEERAALRASVRERVLQAAQVARMTQENLPAGIERYLNEILQPQQDWHELLAEYLTAQEKSDYDWMHPNRRNSVLQVYLPAIHQIGALEHIAIVIDTSGSISEEELLRFTGEILGIVDVCFPRTITIIPCDAEVYEPLVFDLVPQSDEVMDGLQRSGALKGGGGTDMPVALDWIDNNQRFDVPPAVVLVMTDGDTPYGDERPYPVIWCITSSEGNVPDPPWGRTVRIA